MEEKIRACLSDHLFEEEKSDLTFRIGILDGKN